MKKLLLFYFIHILSINSFSQDVEWITGEIIDMDQSGIHVNNKSVIGYDYHYGTFHVKLRTLKNDTIVILQIFNMIDDYEEYSRSFDLEVGEAYIFIVSSVNPCSSDFPRLTGACDEGVFLPEGTDLVSQYEKLPRIISYSLANDELKGKFRH